MSLLFIEGAAGTGKTTRLFKELEIELNENPLKDHQSVLAFTKMHGSRRRMNSRLQGFSGLQGRYRCCTVDSFAWSIVRRWRSLTRIKSASEVKESDYDQVCLLAGDLLAESIVARWVSRKNQIIVVDEFQDCKDGQIAMASSLSRVTVCIAAADGFQDLDATVANPAVEWARRNGKCITLSDNHRTSASGLLNAGFALRTGQSVPKNGNGFSVLGAPNYNVGASYVSKNLTWWRKCNDIAVISPVRPSNSPFVRELIARVEKGPISNPSFGPHSIPWEESYEDECGNMIKELNLPDDSNAKVNGSQFLSGHVNGRFQGINNWVNHQMRVAGKTTFTVEEIRNQVQRSHQQSRAYRRVRERGVRAMTIHQAKNREFHSVIVLWPYEVVGNVERQRRLLYNAITRAKERVLVVVQNRNRLHSQPFQVGVDQ